MKRNRMIILLMFIIFTFSGHVYSFFPAAMNTVDKYITAWQEEDYQGIYNLLSNSSLEDLTVDDIKSAYGDFFEIVGVESIEIVEIMEVEASFFRKVFRVKTILCSKYFNEVHLDYYLMVKREGLINWKLVWDHNLVHPELNIGDTFSRQRRLPERAEIYDRNGKLLAGKGEVVVVGIHPARIEDREELLDRLSELLFMDRDYIDEKIDKYDNPEWFVELKKMTDVNFEIEKEELNSLAGVTFRRKSIDRIYPFAELTAHIVGYLGEVDTKMIAAFPEKAYSLGDRIGKAGLEKTFESQLRGEPGYRLYIQKYDENGELSYRSKVMEKFAVVGDDIYLTLDIDYQSLSYQVLDGKAGSIVLMDPHTGEIVAMSNYPSFDPNDFILGMTSSQWKSLQDDVDNPLLNRAIQGLYPPGSTLKILTAAAALDSDLIDENTIFDDQGEYRVQGNVIRNYQREVFAEHKLEGAIKNSINTTMARLGIDLGKERFREYGERFSFNRKRSFPLPLRESKLGSLDSPVQLAWAAIGQSEVLVTPLEMATLTSLIAADGREVSPLLIKSDFSGTNDSFYMESEMLPVVKKNTAMEQNNRENTIQLIKKGTAELLTSFMKSVVEDGTGEEAAISGIEIAGKTGTAEIEGSDGDKATHAWFTSFAPADNPEYVLLVFLEKGGIGGQDAAPIARQLWQQLLTP